MNKKPRNVISIEEKFRQKKNKKRKNFFENLKKQAVEWGQFAGLLFITWLIMQRCSQLPL